MKVTDCLVHMIHLSKHNNYGIEKLMVGSLTYQQLKAELESDTNVLCNEGCAYFMGYPIEIAPFANLIAVIPN